MWIVEASSLDDSDTLDCSSFHVVDAVRLRTTVACQPDDRWCNSLNRHGGFSVCFRHAGSRGRVHPRVPVWGNGVHEKVDSPEMLDGHRDQVTAALRGGNITGTRDCLASA